jgi:hypothetical protein
VTWLDAAAQRRRWQRGFCVFRALAEWLVLAKIRPQRVRRRHAQLQTQSETQARRRNRRRREARADAQANARADADAERQTHTHEEARAETPTSTHAQAQTHLRSTNGPRHGCCLLSLPRQAKARSNSAATDCHGQAMEHPRARASTGSGSAGDNKTDFPAWRRSPVLRGAEAAFSFNVPGLEEERLAPSLSLHGGK